MPQTLTNDKAEPAITVLLLYELYSLHFILSFFFTRLPEETCWSQTETYAALKHNNQKGWGYLTLERTEPLYLI